MSAQDDAMRIGSADTQTGGARAALTLADALVGEDVEVRERDVVRAQELDGLPREAAARRVGAALHEQHDARLRHERTAPSVELLGALAWAGEVVPGRGGRAVCVRLRGDGGGRAGERHRLVSVSPRYLFY